MQCDGNGDNMPPNQRNNFTGVSVADVGTTSCCRSRLCITTTDFLEMIVLQRDVLSIAIVHRSDTFGDDPEYTIRSYQKAAYRQRSCTWEGEITG